MNAAQPIKLSVLTGLIQEALGNSFGLRSFWIIAEVTNYSFYPSKNYHYFDLVEKARNGTEILAKMQAVSWYAGHTAIRNFEKLTGQKFKNDIQVLIKVSVDFHQNYGLKLTLLDVDVNFTIGALERQRQETLKRLTIECAAFVRLEDDAYITNNNQLRLPAVIQNIAIISSSQSAGLNDFEHTIANNSFGYQFKLTNYHTVVQGEAKADLLYNKLEEIRNSAHLYDAVLIIRGGGSQTDFLIFDQFVLGKMVADFPIPVITGIGHQKNETIVDLMAHTATKTPTKAAEFIIAHNRAFEESIVNLRQTILIKSQQLLAGHSALLNAIQSLIINRSRDILTSQKEDLLAAGQSVSRKSREIIFLHKSSLMHIGHQLSSGPMVMVSGKRNELMQLIGNLKMVNEYVIRKQVTSLQHFSAIIKAMSPENILKKGFAMLKINGEIISDPGLIRKGDELSVILSTEEIKTRVLSKQEYYGKDFDL